MPYIYLVLATFFLSFSSISASFYNRKNEGKRDITPLYNILQLSAVFILWLFKFILNPELDLAVLPYSALFALGYTAAMMSIVFVYREGPIMLSTLIMKLSMISTTVWGFFFWNSPVTPVVISGLVLVVLSLWLCLYTGKGKEQGKKFSVKWLCFIAVYFVGNSVCSITQRTQQLDFNSSYGDFLMATATAVGFTVCLLLYLRSDKSDSKEILKKTGYFPFISGALNFALNLILIILASTSLSPSLIYPVLAVGSLAITTVFSVFIFKEKMFWWQWIGVSLGVVAIALLSI